MGIYLPEVVALLMYCLVGALAAFGALCVLWACLGWLLPGGKGCALVCWGEPDEEIFARYKWLKEAGWLNIPLLMVAEASETAYPEVEICSGKDLLSRLEWERNRYHGTGNGDSSGRGQRRDFSEL